MAAEPSRCLRQKQARRSRGSRPNMQAGCVPRCIFGQRQPGAALRFLQAGAVPRRKNRLSARGKRGDRVQWTNFYLYPPAALLKPLALSQFSLRAAERPCENWSAAPSTPRCICRRQRSGVLAPGLRPRPCRGSELFASPLPRRSSLRFRAPPGRARRAGGTARGRVGR